METNNEMVEAARDWIQKASHIYLDSNTDKWLATEKDFADFATAQIEPYKKALRELIATLEGAVETIHIFHGDVAWEIYRDNSPEMKRINNALAAAKAVLTNGGQDADK